MPVAGAKYPVKDAESCTEPPTAIVSADSCVARDGVALFTTRCSERHGLVADWLFASPL